MVKQLEEYAERFAFISRHAPTEEQYDFCNAEGIFLEWVGDHDAFTVTPEWVATLGEFDGVVVVHPAAALRLVTEYKIGVFENSARPPVDGKPSFTPDAFWVWGPYVKPIF